MNTVLNAAPMPILLGINDQSRRALIAEREVLPTHLPKIYIYAQKGPTTPQLVVGSSRSLVYGADSFDVQRKWYNHATELSQVINAQGNAGMYERIKPSDAGPDASIRLYADVLETTVPVYERNGDGSIKLDADGMPVETGDTIPGIKAKWVAGPIPVDGAIGTATQTPGDQVDEALGTQSVRYPIMDLKAPDFGSYHNNTGLRIWAPTAAGTQPIDTSILLKEKFYPFRMAVVHREDDTSSPEVVETIFAEQFINFSLKPGAVNRAKSTRMYLGDIYSDNYQEFNTPGMPDQYGPFGQVYIYEASVKTLTQKVYDLEKQYIDQFSDLVDSADPDEIWRVNLLGAVHSSGAPYHSMIVQTAGDGAVRLSEVSTVYASGGSDGTMNNAAFAASVATAVSEYANPNSQLLDTAKYPESIIYDSGFPLATKYALCSILARKDTFVVLSTHDVDGTVLTAAEESSMGLALRTRVQMTPESEYFGTSAVRGLVMMHSGRKVDSQYNKRLPLTLELAYKAARYMGAGTGRWVPGRAFDAAPANQIELFTDVNSTFKPASVRNKDWDNGLVWVQQFQRQTLFCPAWRTVYDDDTSVLNSFFTAMACVELEKVGERAWRQFTGSSNLTNAQIIERVNRFVTDNTIGRFDSRFQIVPRAFFTEADLARGYSWSLAIEIYAPNMKTVQTMSIEARRIEDLATA